MQAAVILSGCGYLDGAEIREAVLSLLYLDQHTVKTQCFAPDIIQRDTIDHATKTSTTETRNALVEAARIARSDVKPLSELQENAFDLLVIPGGFGVAKTLSDFALNGANCSVFPEFTRVVESFYNAKKPIVAICIAPAVLAAALKLRGITVTVGDDTAIAAIINEFGNHHQSCASDDAVIDNAHRIVSCSAYMREDNIALIAAGIEKAISAGTHMAKQSKQQAA
jgi:enhancing lycopene biosynthesis protein 2